MFMIGRKGKTVHVEVAFDQQSPLAIDAKLTIFAGLSPAACCCFVPGKTPAKTCSNRSDQVGLLPG